MSNEELIARARKSYRSLDGVVVVSPQLLSDLADALEAAEADISEYVELADRQSGLLRDTAIALHGPPPALTLWSHHDLPELAMAMKSERDAVLTILGDPIRLRAILAKATS